MAYCTQADMVARYGERELVQTTDRNGGGQIDAAVVARACDDAGAVIDGYARSRYATPLVAANAAVALPYACMIARWHLHRNAHPEHVEHEYDAAMRWLRDLAVGKVSMPDLTPSTPLGDTSGSFGVGVSAPSPVFTDALFATATVTL